MGLSLSQVKGGWVYNPPEWPKMELECAEGKIFGARYYTVEPKWCNVWAEMEQWGIDTFGPVSNVWGTSADTWMDNRRWYMNDRKFWFRTEEDRNWFMLRWQ